MELYTCRFWFAGRGESIGSKGDVLLCEDDFIKLGLPNNWHIWTDKNNQGYKVDFPIKLRPILTFSPKNAATSSRIPLEKIWIDFAKVPVDLNHE